MTSTSKLPAPGEIARVRQRLYLVESSVAPPRPGDSTLVSLSCVEDDAQGQKLDVLWEREIDPEVVTGVVREMEPKDPQHPWMMLVQLLPAGTALDDVPESHDRTWHAAPQARFERLLRETRVPIGLLCNATQIRVVYAPRGETSGYATFSVSEMAQVAGRPIFAALHMLLCEERLFSLGEKQRLPAILADSRKYQNVVSTQLAEQVLAALYELVRGLQAADDQAKGELLRAVLAENPNHVYQGLLTVLMRLVFVLYAEDRGLLSSDPIFANYYSLTGLFERLRADDGRYPDTMNQRYGAWAQFLTLFRLIYEGGSHGEFRIPRRDGYLFDPDALKKAATLEELLAALDKKIAKLVTPNVVSKGAIVLQPSDERRRSGSHYTPRSLTEPIVRTTLKPILEQLGAQPTPDQILALKVCDPAMGSGAFLVETCRQLGDELVKAWHFHTCPPKLPPDEDELLHARRLIAQRCLYGVDKNPMAVDLSKLSLWLATLAKDHPFTFLDHSLRAGDSLVGLSRDQIAAFHRQPPTKRSEDAPWFGDPIAAKMKTVTEHRQRILAARDDKPYEQLRQELDVADEALSLARLAGDLVIAAFFSASKDKEREKKLNELARQMVKYVGPHGKIEDRQPLAEAAASLHGSNRPMQPFHWPIEFPEVFTVDEKGKPTGGFDAIVGNPPFAGKNTLINGNREYYLDWLQTIHPESHGNSDLVAHFFRASFNRLRSKGTFGLIATNTIGQGDTRTTGLQWICNHGGFIFCARRRFEWPGIAAVVVSTVWIAKAYDEAVKLLDGRPVEKISAFLFHGGSHDNPSSLRANVGWAIAGTYVLGPGFVFEEGADRDKCSDFTDMEAVLNATPLNKEVIFPYLGGEDVNSHPAQTHSRYIINFGRRTLEECKRYPDVLDIITTKVQGKRGAHSTAPWWQYERPRDEIYTRTENHKRILVHSRISGNLSFSFVPTGSVYDIALNVFFFEMYSSFAVLQSRTHEVWARFLASSMKDDLRYTPSDCFETFPFPSGVLERESGLTFPCLTTDTLEEIGREYYDFRVALMVRHNEGLTKTYNRFHDPHEKSPDILELRRLHAAMDHAVLEAFGWHDLAQTATCDFLLDYEDEEDEEDGSTGAPSSRRQKKKPWRYRWPDEFRDEVLARLLELNKQRAEQERLAGKAANATDNSKTKNKRVARSRRMHANTGQPELFDAPFED